ncbi:protein brambleberry isoform X3 [Microplitis demolitor]|uniref:protein brambleberry isoform X3 n=1 Tax=Microplitis demolitor TaxID=69319 RepID=UPI0004CD2DFE|nr:protein brambleberry isoform X3 [Microplitis demolitor]XP_008554837.1 protein brambleberry isoform X3 [Microplitis demolitor]XP_053594632.1 protein brambleberry isoform X3 [Microplitis demolitor]
MKHLIIVMPLILSCVSGSSLLSWFWDKPSDNTNVLVTDGIPLVAIPYEAMTEDEKFLQEAAKITDIQLSSPLETCQHKVVMKIRTSCSGMTEEELAKLSVNLLNCQSSVEGRKIFPCTEEMSLKQCTTDMDADMWNAYHLMSNRARAVCYTARSTQFRALTELTVNKLMQSARSQVDALAHLKESHEKLEDKTLEALSSLSQGNKILLEQQQYLKNAQSLAHKFVANNIRELTNEKALIRTGHLQLATMTEDIKKKLEKASEQLLSQASERQENHKELLEDLENIQQQAQLIWDKIESSTNRIVQQNAEAAAQFEQTLEKLEKINDTIHFIWNLTESMRTEVEEKLSWITDYIGNTGEQLQKVYQISLHIVYLLGAMIIAAFLNAPFLTRASIMGLIPMNLVSFLKHGMNACLDFTSLTMLIFLITGMHFIMVGIHAIFGVARDRKTRIEKLSGEFNNKSNGHLPSQPSPLPTPVARKYFKTNFVTRLSNTLQDTYKFIVKQLSRCKGSVINLWQYMTVWYGQHNLPMEELSCSYLPSKKSREDVIEDYAREHPTVSEDDSDFDRSLNNENIIDASELRYRWNHNERLTPASTYSAQSSPSRSVSPNLVSSPKILCSAFTKTGAKCRSRAQQGRYFCSRHSQGSSILGD